MAAGAAEIVDFVVTTALSISEILRMINPKDHYVGWALLLYELEDAHEHLGVLIKDMVSDPEYSDVEFRIQLGHVYAHLNRAWYRRNVPEDIPKEQWDKATEFPSDIGPLV